MNIKASSKEFKITQEEEYIKKIFEIKIKSKQKQSKSNKMNITLIEPNPVLFSHCRSESSTNPSYVFNINGSIIRDL